MDRQAELLEQFLCELQKEFPRFRLVAKRGHWLSHLIDWLLRGLTLGAQSEYLTHYHTVLGYTLYVPDSWESTPALDRLITLRHERIHLRQRRRYGFWLMALVYLIPIFPLGLAWGRAKLEWEAYCETIWATAELKGVAEARCLELRQHIIKQFTSGAYGWMWPFPRQIEKWYDAALMRLATPPRGASPLRSLRPE